MQFLEITDILRLQHEQTNSRPCVLLLVIDSYDDLLQYARESEKAQVSAEVERVLEDFMQGTDGVIRKVENDLFYAVMESRHLHEIMNNRFHVLDELARYGSTTGCTLPFHRRRRRCLYAGGKRKVCPSVAGYGTGTRRRPGGSQDGKRILFLWRRIQGRGEKVQDQDTLHCPRHAGTHREFRPGISDGTPFRRPGRHRFCLRSRRCGAAHAEPRMWW